MYVCMLHARSLCGLCILFVYVVYLFLLCFCLVPFCPLLSFLCDVVRLLRLMKAIRIPNTLLFEGVRGLKRRIKIECLLLVLVDVCYEIIVRSLYRRREREKVLQNLKR